MAEILGKCGLYDRHKLEFIEDTHYDNLSEIAGFFQCQVCGAESDTFVLPLSIDGESISAILSKQEQDELRAIDNDRIGAGLAK